MKDLLKKIPLATYFYILNVIYGIITIARYNTEGFMTLPTIIPIVFDIICIVLLFRNKKDIALFSVSAIISLKAVVGLLSGFGIGSALNCVGSVLTTYIIATIVFPQLAENQAKVKKLYYLPALIILVSSIISNANIIQYKLSPESLFFSLILPAATSFFFVSWCIKSEDESPAGNKKEKSIFRVIAIIFAICVALSFYMKLDSKSNRNPSSGSSNGGVSYGEGGYEMPNESDDSFADYVQRVDPDLYDAMQDRYNEAAGK